MFEKIKIILNKIKNLINSKNITYRLSDSKNDTEIKKDDRQMNETSNKSELKENSVDETEVKKIYEAIKEEAPKFDISEENIKQNYSKYKAIYEQQKVKWLRGNEDIPLEKLIEIIYYLSEKDMEYIRDENFVSQKLVIHAIYDMGLEKFLELRNKNQLQNFMNAKNFLNTINTNTTKAERELLLRLSRYDVKHESFECFYMYYDFIKNNDKEKIDFLLQTHKDAIDYLNGRSDKKDSGYKWIDGVFLLPPGFEMSMVRRLDTHEIMELKEKTKVPINIIISAMVTLDAFPKSIDKCDFEKIVVNYNKFNLNILGDLSERRDTKQIKSMLLSLPNDLEKNYELIIKECLLGKYKNLNINNYERLQDYQRICEERISKEFENSDNIADLKKLILKFKVNDLDGIKRDLYFYKKYIGEKVEENKIYNLLVRLLNSEDKEEILNTYKSLNNINEEFIFDNLLNGIRGELSEISKNDIVTKMHEMQEKIKNANMKDLDGQKVIDLTGTDFNLLISVIGSQGSPYLVRYYNSIVNKPYSEKIKKALIVQGTKRLVNKRYKADLKKNKQRCVSSINEDFIGHIRSQRIGNKKQMEDKLVLVYFPKRKEDIFWMGNQDLMTIYDKDRNDPTRKRVPHKDNMTRVCNLKLDDLNSSTRGDDNEIVIDSYPGAVICFDKVSEISKKTAKKLKCPILYINSKEQFKIMQEKLNKYYDSIQEKILKNTSIDEDIFKETFNVFEQDSNIIHRAFKIANSFGYIDDDEYPKEEVIKIFDKMKNLVGESLKRCNLYQKEIVQTIMKKEADSSNVRYGKYYDFIDFQELIDLTKNEEDQILK